MKINELSEAGVGKIVKGVNTTPDVQPGETERQAKKLFPMNKDGKPKSMGVRGATPNEAFNLGLTENMSVTGTERRRAEKKKGIEIGSPEWFKHWFDLPYLREDISKQELLSKLKDQQRGRYLQAMLDAMHRLVQSKGAKHSLGNYAFEIGKVFGFDGKELEKMYKDMYMAEANTVTTQSDAGTVVKDRSGGIRSVSTPRVGGLKLKQTFRPDSTPGYQQANFKSGGTTLDVKGSPETGYTNTAKTSIGGFSAQAKQRYDGSKQAKVDYNLGKGKKYSVTQNIPESIQKVDVEQLEKFADRLFGKVGIDVEFTRHFMDRVNDVRNQKPITMSELTRLFKQEYKRWGKPIAQMGPNSQAVMKDLQTNINLPFVLRWDDKNNELDLIAKTVMRKQDFKTPNKEFPVESVVNERVMRGANLLKLIDAIADELGVTPAVARAIAYQESGHNHTTKDGKVLIGDKKLKNKAYGAFQVRLPALQDVNRLYKTNYTIDDLRDPNINARVGLLYYKAQTEFYGAKNDKQALAGYNGGPAAIKGKNKKANSYSSAVLTTASTAKPKTVPRVYDDPKNPNPQSGEPTDNGIGTIWTPPKTVRKAQPVDPSIGTIWTPPKTAKKAKAKPTTDNGVGTIYTPPKADKVYKAPSQWPINVSAPVQPSVPPTEPAPVIPSKPNVTYQDLANASGISDPNKIFVGGKVNLPNGSVYTIQPGDTLSGIAKNYNKSAMGEAIPSTNKPGTIGQQINWGGKNKPTQNKKVSTKGTQNPQSWWQTMLAKGKGMFEDEQLDLKKKFEIIDELSKLANIFNRGGHEIRIVGGAVRDLALDKTPKDIDLATDATPDEMQRMFDSAGVRHIPTGIEHGTITAVINGEEFEVTTLRADVETDGRRAEVEFVRSWEEDAKRRDLTYNAMSMDFEGNLYDYHGGMDDLQDKVTRFVGDPEERIKEDYLRTLRYFRFQGRLDTPTFDRETMQAIASNTAGLKQLSVERVWMEMGKILSGSNINQILGAMQKTGVLGAIGLDVKPSQDIMDGGDPIINLARITDDESIGVRWKMSNEEKGKLGFLISQKGQTHDKKWYTDQMADGFDRTQLDALARYNNQDDMIQYIKSFKAPEFPVGGNDLLKLGHERGPRIGKTLQALRTQWKAGNFSASKDELLKSLSEKITKRTPMGDVIDDFYQSDAPQFKGKSKKKRRQMAIAAKLSKMDENFIAEGIMLKLERDYNADILVLHVKDTKTHRRTEVRGKLGYESGGYDEKDKLHQLLDKIGKAANISDLMNGEIVHINPNHPKGPESIKTATKLANENFADGKKPGRKGLSKRVGIPKGATLAQLEKIAKNSSGEKRRMAQWQLNMRRGKNK